MKVTVPGADDLAYVVETLCKVADSGVGGEEMLASVRKAVDGADTSVELVVSDKPTLPLTLSLAVSKSIDLLGKLDKELVSKVGLGGVAESLPTILLKSVADERTNLERTIKTHATLPYNSTETDSLLDLHIAVHKAAELSIIGAWDDDGVVAVHDAVSVELSKRGFADTLGRVAVTKHETPIDVRLAKADDDEHYVLGIVLEPNDGEDGTNHSPHTQNDVYSKSDVRHTAHRWMSDFRNVGLMHKGIINNKVKVVESYLAPVDFDLKVGEKIEKVAAGTWLLGVVVTDEAVWKSIKAGELTGFSIGGSAIRVDAA